MMDTESTLGKIFLANISAWLLGKKTYMKVRGNAEQVHVLKGALEASKRFNDELYRQGATVQTIMDVLQAKRIAVSEFERAFDLRWPL